MPAPRAPLHPRTSGVLLHPTSLPGGRLGPEAYAFVDWLAAAGQTWWQVLPLGPPDRFGSPYTSSSAFAGSPALLAEPHAPVDEAELADFRRANRYWIDDWERYAGPGAAEDQVRFEREWQRLRRYAAERGVGVIGDVAIYVGAASVDVRAHPELFRHGEMAAAPPDAFSADGQVWGNPLYDWAAHRREGYRWWIERLRRALALADVVRIDHFRGFVAYWTIPRGARTARNGRWRRGPGRALFDAVEAELGGLPVVVEDLGVITPAVHRLRDELGVPGMRILQSGFDGRPGNQHAPANVGERRVLYTGSHDNPPLAAWWATRTGAVRARVAKAVTAAGIAERDPVWALIRLALSTRAGATVVQAQDVLGLGADARLNTPGTMEGNWRWRLEPGALTPQLAERLRTATAETGRAPSRAQSAARTSRRSS
jgi:4-alpha-glucanotransferase